MAEEYWQESNDQVGFAGLYVPNRPCLRSWLELIEKLQSKLRYN